ncbi:hypothetical protein [Streptomyces corynorhini]|uniref:hypothetical protein n=1 Tax=Streptomyces corynorhini TaxID=2282652 RepID=UPI001F3D7A70|nr:hypothetical protein [Streptomyces corynorhini]
MATPVRTPPRHRASWLHAPHRTAPHRTAPHRTAPHRTAAPGRGTVPQGASRYDPPAHASAPRAPYGVARGATPAVAHGARRRLSPLALGLPLLLGIVYGAYAAAIARDGGPATNGQLALALVSGAVLVALLVGLLLVQHSLPRELRAAAWGAVTGASIGFLMCLSGHSVFSSSGLGLFVAACTTAAVFYRLYTTEPTRTRENSENAPPGPRPRTRTRPRPRTR